MTKATEITVIVTVYNQSIEDIRKTLASIATQKSCSYELIVGDDHSTEDRTTAIREVCEELSIPHFKVLRHAKNLKTVGNVLACLQEATGTYVKLIGSGDTLYDCDTLRSIVDFCNEHSLKAGFGDIVIESTGQVYGAPRNTECYEFDATIERAEIFNHMLLYADWIPGGAQFFERQFMIDRFKLIHDEMGIRYCEDIAQTMSLLETRVFHLKRPILIYDNQGGISTSGSLNSRTKMYDDHLSFFTYVAKTKPFNRDYGQHKRKFMMKRFIALKTPIYPLLQKIAMKSYTK